jgi:LPS sulfotransferase NodH
MGKRFVVIAARRTGSNWLCARLRAQPDVWCHGEVFHPDRVWIRTPDDTDPFGNAHEPELRACRASERDKFLERVFDLSFERAHVGFKIFPEHWEGEAFRLADDASLSKIILYRSNFLAVYASLLAALQTGAYSAEEMLRVKRPRVTFSAEQFLDWRASYEEFYRLITERLRATGQHFPIIRSDELNVNDRFAMLLEFLGAVPEVVPLAAPPVRGTPEILARFSNPKVVETHLREHGLMQWAEERDLQSVSPG